MAYYRFVGSTNAYDDIAYIVLETDEDGNPTKTIGRGGVAQMTKAQVESLDRFIFEPASKEDAAKESEPPAVTEGLVAPANLSSGPPDTP